MKDLMTLTLFAKKLGYRRTDAKEFQSGLKYLRRIGALKVEQGGFFAHSCHHPKIVIIKDWTAVNLHFNVNVESSAPRLKKRRKHTLIIYQYTCHLPDSEKCSSRKSFTRQGLVCIFQGNCNQQRPLNTELTPTLTWVAHRRKELATKGYGGNEL